MGGMLLQRQLMVHNAPIEINPRQKGTGTLQSG